MVWVFDVLLVKVPYNLLDTTRQGTWLTYKLKLTLTDKKALNKDTLNINDNLKIKSGTSVGHSSSLPSAALSTKLKNVSDFNVPWSFLSNPN